MDHDAAAPNFRRILVACDFSPSSKGLIPYAISFAQSCGASLLLAHIASPEVISVEPPVVVSQLRSAQAKVRELQASQQLEGVEHFSVIEEGDPAEELLKVARQNDVDLIMMGTHGRTGFRKFVIGSVAERVFRSARCPVLTIGPHVVVRNSGKLQVGRILCAIGSFAHKHPAIQQAIGIAQCHSAAITLLHVASAESAADSANETSALRQRLLDLVCEEKEDTESFEAVVEVGMVSERIIEAALSRRAEMIVLDALPPAMLTPHLMDTAYRVIVGAPCPVMTVLVTQVAEAKVRSRSAR